ncbi:MAG: QueT transporter family protein [Ruminococcaceae bacterium]|nr:QueT transporter family protein [Oscillospiraceae bacterium]
MRKKQTRGVGYLTRAAMIAALYVVLTWLSALFGLSGMGAVQLRLSEMLCILPCFTASAVPGVTLGCLLANLLTGAALPDVIFGTLATLLGAAGTRLLRRFWLLASVPPILSNTLIIPFVIRYAYVGVEESLGFLFVSVGAGELLSVGVLGTLLLVCLERYRHVLFPDEL